MEKAGRFTGCALDNITSLLTHRVEMNGREGPVFSQDAASLSLELAATAYDVQMDAWQAAGWHDFSYHTDNKLLTGTAVNGEKGVAGILGSYLRRLAKSRILRDNPISQIRGALRQRESSDTCKAVIMIRNAPGGKYLVAIGFMGTGKRIYDWFSNFRLEREENTHKGFLQLVREFEEKADRILFPETARELNLDRLSLQDIFLWCRREDSPFRIWMAGHSQGGAIMQLLALREISRGMLPCHLLGYGFASPSVLYENPGYNLAGFPLFHIINSDDVTPRIGAMLHVGETCVLIPENEMREKCYAKVWESDAFRAALREMQTIRDTKTALLWTMALGYAIQDLPDAEGAEVITGMFGRLVPEKILNLLGGRMERGIDYIIRTAEKGYMLATGELKAPMGTVNFYRQKIRMNIGRYGAKAYVQAVLKALSQPHKLRNSGEDQTMASYQYIVTHCFTAIRWRIWHSWAPYRLQDERKPAHKRTAGSRFAVLSAQRSRRKR